MVVVHLKFLAMATRKFSASEVLHMLTDDEELNAFSQLEQESEDDDEVCGLHWRRWRTNGYTFRLT